MSNDSGSNQEPLLRALQLEIGEKAARLKRLGGRWIVSTALAILCGLLIERADGEHRSQKEATIAIIVTLVPWLSLWVLKAVWDVIEDVLAVRRSSALYVSLSAIFFSAVTALSFAMPFSRDVPLAALVTAMLLGSALAGSIDTPAWAGAAIIISHRLWLTLDFLRALRAMPRHDFAALALGVSMISALDAVQERLVQRIELRASSTQMARPLRAFFGFKVGSSVATLALAFVAARQKATVAQQTALLALISPHFVVYDASKILFCVALWLRAAVQIDGGDQPSTAERAESSATQIAGPFGNLSRRVMFRACVALSGRTAVFVSDERLAERVLRNCYTKGDGLERFLSRRMFRPIVPTESVDGERWRSMRISVVRLLRAVGPADFERKLARELHGCSLFDSAALSNALAVVLHEFVFGERPTSSIRDLWIKASLAWRGQLAVKARGDAGVMRDAFETARNLIRRAPAYIQDAVSLLENEEERVSVVLQPFLVSPLINVSDGVVAATILLRKDAALRAQLCDSIESADPKLATQVANRVSLLALSFMPPFPVLEREVYEDDFRTDAPFTVGSHVFVESDAFGRRALHSNESPPEWLAFGLGPRACPGRALGMQLMAGFVLHGIGALLVQGKDAAVCPEQGHMYSGRHLDGQEPGNFTDALFQLQQVCAGLVSAATAAPESDTRVAPKAK